MTKVQKLAKAIELNIVPVGTTELTDEQSQLLTEMLEQTPRQRATAYNGNALNGDKKSQDIEKAYARFLRVDRVEQKPEDNAPSGTKPKVIAVWQFKTVGVEDPVVVFTAWEFWKLNSRKRNTLCHISIAKVEKGDTFGIGKDATVAKSNHNSLANITDADVSSYYNALADHIFDTKTGTRLQYELDRLTEDRKRDQLLAESLLDEDNLPSTNGVEKAIEVPVI